MRNIEIIKIDPWLAGGVEVPHSLTGEANGQVEGGWKGFLGGVYKDNGGQDHS